MNTERLLKIISTPIISEKATFVSEKNNQVVFRVIADATKLEIKSAVEFIFKVQVNSVQILNQNGKRKKSGRFMGKRRNERKAYVSLKTGQQIDFSGII